MKIKWVGSPNYNLRPTNEVGLVVIHHSANSSLDGIIKWFNNPVSMVSAHYSIGKDGTIVQHVKDAHRAWHAGVSIWKGRPDVNNYSIGIELINMGDGIDPYPESQHQSLVELCKFLVNEYRIDGIVGHYQVNNEKVDPLGYNLDRLREDVFVQRGRPGLWLTNGHPGDTIDDMYSWNPPAVTCIYDYLGANKVLEYKQKNPDTKVIIRFMHPKNWMDSPQVSATNYGKEVASKWVEIEKLGENVYCYFANEMNLHYESGRPFSEQGYFDSKEFYQKYAKWVEETAKVIKDIVPEMNLICPPFAYGHGEDGHFDGNGKLVSDWLGYDFLIDTIKKYFDNRIAYHSYWGDGSGQKPERLYDPNESYWHGLRVLRVADLFEKHYGIEDIKIIIDEVGNFEAGHPDFINQVRYFSDKVLSDRRIEAATFFLWYDPTNSPGNISNGWVNQMSKPKLKEFVNELKLIMSEVKMFDYRSYVDKFLRSPSLPDPKYDIRLVEGKGDYQVIGVHHLSPSENIGKHNVYLAVIDEAGKRIPNAKVNWEWEGITPKEKAGLKPVTLDKPNNEPPGNVVMWSNQKISVWIDGDRVDNLHTLHPDESEPGVDKGNSIGHHSFLVVFKKGQSDTEPPKPSENNELPEFLEKLDPIIKGINQVIREFNELVAEYK